MNHYKQLKLSSLKRIVMTTGPSHFVSLLQLPPRSRVSPAVPPSPGTSQIASPTAAAGISPAAEPLLVGQVRLAHVGESGGHRWGALADDEPATEHSHPSAQHPVEEEAGGRAQVRGRQGPQHVARQRQDLHQAPARPPTRESEFLQYFIEIYLFYYYKKILKENLTFQIN